MSHRIFWMSILLVTLTLGGCATRRPAETIRASGEHRFKTGDYAGARDEFAELVSYYPGDWQGQFMLGQSLLQTGEYAAARRALETAMAHTELRKIPNQDVADALAEAMLQQGDESRLIAFLRQRATTTQSIPAYLKLAHYCMALNDPDSAQTAIETAIEIDKGRTTDPYYEAALLAERVGNLDDAVRRLKQAYGINPHDLRVIRKLEALGETPGKISPLPPGR